MKKKKEKSALDEFLALAKKYGMTYAELQQRETKLKFQRRTIIDKEKYRSKNEEAAGN